MAIVVTINGTTVTPLGGTLEVSQTYGGRKVCRFDFLDIGGAGYHPTMGEEVIVTDGGTRIFGGSLQTLGEEGLVEASLVDLVRHVTAAGWIGKCDQRIVTESYPTGTTLETLITDLRTKYMDAFGITIDAAQVTGPTLEAISWDHRTLTDALNDLAGITGYTPQISDAKVFGMYENGTIAAPFSLTNATRNYTRISWELTHDRGRNRQYLSYGPTGVLQLEDYWTATAAQTSFTLHYTGVTGYRVVTAQSAFWPVGVYGVDAMQWTYDAALNRIVKSGGTALSAGDEVRFAIDASFPQVAMAETAAAATDPWEATDNAPDIIDYAQAENMAEALLGRYASAKRVSFTTYTAGLAVGQTITISLTERHLTTTYLVTSLRASHERNSALRMRYDVECVAGAVARNEYLDTYRKWSGKGNTISGTVAFAGGVAAAPSVAGGDGAALAQGLADAANAGTVLDANGITISAPAAAADAQAFNFNNTSGDTGSFGLYGWRAATAKSVGVYANANGPSDDDVDAYLTLSVERPFNSGSGFSTTNAMLQLMADWGLCQSHMEVLVDTIRWGGAVGYTLTQLFNGIINLLKQPYAKVYSTTASATITASTNTVLGGATLQFDSELADTQGMHSTGSNQQLVTVPTDAGGVYLVLGQVQWAVSGGPPDAHDKWVFLTINGGAICGFVVNNYQGATNVVQQCYAVAQLAAGESVYMSCRSEHASGTVSVLGGDAAGKTCLTVAKLH